MMAQGPLTFSIIGKPILRTFEILTIFRFFDLPDGQGPGPGPWPGPRPRPWPGPRPRPGPRPGPGPGTDGRTAG